MKKRIIVTFQDFITHILKLVFWMVFLSSLISIPAILVLDLFDLVSIIDLISFVMGLPAFLADFTKTDFFRLSTFPGFLFATLFATGIGLWERKLLAKMQLRVGPLYAGRVEGILQPMADALKLLMKEIITPYTADKLFFWAVPLITVAIASSLIAVIPLSEFWVIARSDLGLLIVFAVIGFFPLSALLAAWASNSKYPFIGGLRALHQMIAYEIPMILSALGPVILTGSLDFVTITKAQSPFWFVLLQPIGALVFFITILAELERIPFDLPEAESEIVAGWLTEYTGMHFGLILGIAVYMKFYAMAAIFTSLFLGGWLGPAFLPPEVWFIIKTFVVVTLLIIPRGVYPRIRIDIMLRSGWSELLVLALANLFLAVTLVNLGVVTPGGPR